MRYDSPMSSRKPQAKAKRLAQFRAGLGGMDDVFATEARRDADAFSEKQRRACSAKHRYESREDAEEAARTCITNGRRTLRVYRCDYCDGWHLTSKPGW